MRYELNHEQKRAVNSRAKKICCLAGAGTGKTRTIIERIVTLVDEGVDPSEILALTFTNAAAFEMKSRYKEYVKTGRSPEFRTFHSYCYELLSSDRDIRKALGYTSMPKIADDRKQERINKEAIIQSGIKLTKKQMEGKVDLSVLSSRNLEILNKFKKRLLNKENLITFDELCNGICNLFINNDPLIEKYREQIKYLHVDEYQDTDPVQHKFVMSFEGHSSIFVVGDVLQNLYSFRGTDSSILKSISMKSDWEVIKLTHNYRSTQKICEFANEFSKTYADDIYRTPIESDKSGSPVETREYTNWISSTKFHDIFKRIAFECGVLNGTVAIIARTNKEVATIKRELDANGILYTTNHKEVDAKFVLPSVTDSKFMINWLSTFLPAERYTEFIRISSIKTVGDEDYTEQDFLNNFGDMPDIANRAENIYNIRKILHGPEELSVKCKEVLKAIGYPKLKIDLSNVSKLSDLISNIMCAIDTQHTQESEVYVGTIHSVKGLEYDTVYVMGVNWDYFALDNEDNKNCYYVAITRAKDYLVIYS